jgi:transcriptional regulator of arginine metabolism
MNKAYRHGQILNIIRTQRVQTQEELAQALRQIGISATQVTLSRDIRELGLVKTAAGYRQIAAEPPAHDFTSLAGEFLQDVRYAQNLLVLKTLPGNANALAAALDRERWPEVVGTVAGDDTILVILPDTAAAQQVRRRLLDLLGAPS